MLRLSGLSVSYGGLHALADVALEVGEGEFVTIVGPNGAGRTTLLKAIGGGGPAASSRCSPSAGDSWRDPTCCCSTSRRRDSGHGSSRSSSRRSRPAGARAG